MGTSNHVTVIISPGWSPTSSFITYPLTNNNPSPTQVKANLSIIKKMLQDGADIHACDDQGQNIMHEIARYHDAEICYFFLKHNVNPNLGW